MPKMIEVTLSQLTHSPKNARTNYDPKADKGFEALVASIVRVGLIQPIVVRAKGAKFQVSAGQRRFEAMKVAVTQRADLEPINAVLLQKGDDESEVSLAENYAREQMSLPEVYSKFRAIQAEHPERTVEEMGAMFGYDAPRAARIMRLANLSHKTMQAYRAGDLNDAQAAAFASTEDHDLQDRVLAQLEGVAYDHQRGPAAIKRLLGAMTQDEATMMSFVGRDVYIAAGGEFEIDLFDSTAGIINSPDLLARLYREEVDRHLDRFSRRLKRNGRMFKTDGPWALKDLDFEFVSEAPQVKQHGYLSTDYDLHIRTPKLEPAGADIHHPDTVIILPKKGAIVATHALKAGAEGAYLDITLWYRDRAAKGVAGPVNGTAIGAGSKAKSAGEKQRADWGLTKDGMGAMLVVQRDMIRDQLMWEPELALDFLLYSQARAIVRTKSSNYPGGGVSRDGMALGIATPPSEEDHQLQPPSKVRQLADTVSRAPSFLDAFDKIAALPCMQAEDPLVGFPLFCREGGRIKDLCTCLVAGWGLRSATNFYGDPELPRFTQGFAATYLGRSAPWSDSVVYDKAFFELINHKKRIAILESWGAGEQAKRLKSNDSAEYCAKVFAFVVDGGSDVEAAAIYKVLGIREIDQDDIRSWRPEWLDPTLPPALADRASPSSEAETEA